MSIFILALVGYLAGSLSGARIVGRRWAQGADLSTSTVVLDGTGASVETRGVSSSSLQATAGAAGGLRAAVIDIAKAFLPTLAARVVWPDGPAAVVVAGAALVGHVFPIYHRFVGGYGIAPLIGGLLVIDLPALVASIAVFALLGVILGSAYIGIETWPLGLIPWFAVFGDRWGLAYALLANVLYWWRSWPEAAGAYRSWRRDQRPWRTRLRDFAKYPEFEVPQE